MNALVLMHVTWHTVHLTSRGLYHLNSLGHNKNVISLNEEQGMVQRHKHKVRINHGPHFDSAT